MNFQQLPVSAEEWLWEVQDHEEWWRCRNMDSKVSKIKVGDILTFEGCDRIDYATVKVTTQKAILVEWVVGTDRGDATSTKWLPKSQIEKVEKDRSVKGWRVTLPSWIWERS